MSSILAQKPDVTSEESAIEDLEIHVSYEKCHRNIRRYMKCEHEVQNKCLEKSSKVTDDERRRREAERSRKETERRR